MKVNNLKALFFVGILSLGHMGYAGNANYNFYMGARTLALNGMYIAGVDGLTANFNNPAAPAFLTGVGLDFSLLAKIGEYTYINPEQKMYKSFREEDPIFGLGGFWNLNPNTTITIGYLPFIDYRVDWPYAILFGEGSNQVILTFDMNNKIQVKAWTVDIAYGFKSFAIGLALNAYQVRHRMAFPQAISDWSAETILESAYQFNYDQDAWTYGFNIGIMWDLSENFRLGALLRSSFKADLDGTASSDMFRDIALADTNYTGTLPPTEVNMNSKIEFPWVGGLGLLYKVSDQLRINADLMYHLWANVKNEMNIEFDDPAWNNGLSEVDSLTGITGGVAILPGENSMEIGIGLEYLATSDLILRAGYRFSQTPNKPETYNLAFPTVSQHWLSVGIGLDEGNYLIDLTAAYAFGMVRSIEKPENNYWYGEYDGQTFIPAFSLKYEF